ncbi:MAG: lipoyl domain-containing protein [Rhizobiaceae bacterium]|nr:lipoyl domain-containing protein [Rhizobiaceae bacterium]
MAITLKLPRISMNMVEATLVSWGVEEGATFRKGDVLYSVETEKVTSDIEAEGDGVLLEILAPAGSEIEVGTPVCKVNPV